jgi:hypothetical protein
VQLWKHLPVHEVLVAGKAQCSSCSSDEELHRSIRTEPLTSLMVTSPLKVHHFPSPYLAVIRVTDARNRPLTLNPSGVLGYPVLGQAARWYGRTGPWRCQCSMLLT